MDTLFGFDDIPTKEEASAPKDWNNEEIVISSNPMVRAYGKGPEGVKCRRCKYLQRQKYHDYIYRKCTKRGITRGPGTDHKVSFEACKLFEER